MILGTGVDIIEVGRVERLLKKDPRPDRIYTDEELEACRAGGFGFKRTAARLAGLFAAKEAVMKALGTGWTKGAAFTGIRISHTDAGMPRVRLTGETAVIAGKLGTEKVHISISHTDTHAVAVAVLEGAPPARAPEKAP